MTASQIAEAAEAEVERAAPTSQQIATVAALLSPAVTAAQQARTTAASTAAA